MLKPFNQLIKNRFKHEKELLAEKGELNERQLTFFKMRYISQLSPTEISLKTNWSVSTVEKDLRDVREKIYRVYKNDFLRF